MKSSPASRCVKSTATNAVNAVASATVVIAAAVAVAADSAAVVTVATAVAVDAVATSEPTLRGRPDRIFVSVNQSTNRSTISFQPPDVSAPIEVDDDQSGTRAMKDAKAISASYPGCTVHGPHFHVARPSGRQKIRRRPPRESGEGSGEGSGEDAS